MTISGALDNNVVVGLGSIFERHRVPINIRQNWLLNTHLRPIGILKSGIASMGDVSLDGAKFPALQRNILGRVAAANAKDPLASIQLAIDEIVSVNVSAY